MAKCKALMGLAVKGLNIISSTDSHTVFTVV